MLQEHKNLVVDQIAHQNVFKSSNFADGFVVLVLVRRCPYWRPCFKTALASHEGMVTELHDSLLDRNHAQLSTEGDSVGKATIKTSQKSPKIKGSSPLVPCRVVCLKVKSVQSGKSAVESSVGLSVAVANAINGHKEFLEERLLRIGTA
jgi:hypothetical protein